MYLTYIMSPIARTGSAQKGNDIKKKYVRLCAKKYNGKKIYSHEYILEKISKKFYLTTNTIEAIVTGRYEKLREHQLRVKNVS